MIHNRSPLLLTSEQSDIWVSDLSSLSQGNKVMIGICILFASKLMYDTLVHKTGAIPSEYFSLKKRPLYKEYMEKTSQFFPRF